MLSKMNAQLQLSPHQSTIPSTLSSSSSSSSPCIVSPNHPSSRSSLGVIQDQLQQLLTALGFSGNNGEFATTVPILLAQALQQNFLKLCTESDEIESFTGLLQSELSLRETIITKYQAKLKKYKEQYETNVKQLENTIQQQERQLESLNAKLIEAQLHSLTLEHEAKSSKQASILAVKSPKSTKMTNTPVKGLQSPIKVNLAVQSIVSPKSPTSNQSSSNQMKSPRTMVKSPNNSQIQKKTVTAIKSPKVEKETKESEDIQSIDIDAMPNPEYDSVLHRRQFASQMYRQLLDFHGAMAHLQLLCSNRSIPTIRQQLVDQLLSSQSKSVNNTNSVLPSQSNTININAAVTKPNSNNGRGLELFAGYLFKALGFTIVICGGGKSDGGIDLLLQKGGVESIVQCKQYIHGKVTDSEIRFLYGVMTERNVNSAYYLTTSYFTTEARKFQQNNAPSLILWDRDQLLMNFQQKAIQMRNIQLNNENKYKQLETEAKDMVKELENKSKLERIESEKLNAMANIERMVQEKKKIRYEQQMMQNYENLQNHWNNWQQLSPPTKIKTVMNSGNSNNININTTKITTSTSKKQLKFDNQPVIIPNVVDQEKENYSNDSHHQHTDKGIRRSISAPIIEIDLTESNNENSENINNNNGIYEKSFFPGPFQCYKAK